ncbi:YncE family protein [Mycoplana dimorpha]|uniref:YncE family protein n=1 Tax=Mycoplana dimorpha TaxID=28320 RepID=UPI0011B28CED|nr:hypothetical protein [Mycoplana dimorpha]
MFVNVPDARQVVVADLKSRKRVTAWKTPGLTANFPMALDGTSGELAIVFRNPAKLTLWDVATGAISENLDTCGDADDVFFDGKRGRIYVSCGSGAIDVVQRGRDGLRPAGRMMTSSGARTSLFVPEFDRLFVAARAGGPRSVAAILEFRSGRDGRRLVWKRSAGLKSVVAARFHRHRPHTGVAELLFRPSVLLLQRIGQWAEGSENDFFESSAYFFVFGALLAFCPRRWPRPICFAKDERASA